MSNQFSDNAPVANPLFYRSYSRPDMNGKYESWEETIERSIEGLRQVGKLTDKEVGFMRSQFLSCSVMPSGRWLWCGGTEWSKKPENVYGGYNCSATAIDSIETFGYLMNLAMQGCGTGAGLEDKFISQLPIIRNALNVTVDETTITHKKLENTETHYSISEDVYSIYVGDSRQGWVDSYMELIKLSSEKTIVNSKKSINVLILIGNVRPAGQRLQGFGGVSNPIKLPQLYNKIATILNKAVGRKLTAEECCLIFDEAALVVVAGNLRRSAGIRQFDSTAPLLKTNLWKLLPDGNWRIDPDKDALRMSNHTRVYHSKPSRKDCIDAVRSQYQSGEGAIQWAGEAIARGNADILDTPEKRKEFIEQYNHSNLHGINYLRKVSPYHLTQEEIKNRINRYLLNPCGI